MDELWRGRLGTVLGVACAGCGIAIQIRRQRRAGDPATVAAVLVPSRQGLEREALRRACAVALPLYVAAVTVAAAVWFGPTAAGASMGAAGLILGVAAAGTTRYLSR
jgi:hypothetical protein